ncbi:MAG: class I SAM-dependent methyltransferase [bacterium]
MSGRVCRICAAADLTTFLARELLTNSGETFLYAHCVTCGCLQILDVPADLGRFYGGRYGTVRRSWFKQKVRSAGFRLAFPAGPLGRIEGLILPFVNAGVITALREWKVPRTASFLDVGSGTGRFLHALRAVGFNGPLLGIDPFLRADITGTHDVELRRARIEDIVGSFDVITLVHSLEHIEGQLQTLSVVRRLLRPQGICIISLPLAGGWAWKEYGPDWVQLDPPRHIILHTPKSFALLAQAANLRVRSTIWDSTAFQFWGSDLAKKRKPILPLLRSFLRSAWRVPVDAFRAAKLNAAGQGDQATFVLSA